MIHSSRTCWGLAFRAGKDPIIPALHWAITRSGPDTRKSGAPITGMEILSLICLILVAVSGNLLKLVKESKILLYISLLPCFYILIYGLYVTVGPIDLYKDGTENYFQRNPGETELPVVFVLLKFYQSLQEVKRIIK